MSHVSAVIPWVPTPNHIYTYDALTFARHLAPGSVQTVVTSPPYYSLRDYGTTGQWGMEDTIEAYVSRLVTLFREIHRALADDGTLWLNLGDSYAGSGKGQQGKNGQRAGRHTPSAGIRTANTGLADKNLIGIPWRVALALQADGWILRSDIIWHKPNPMPEPVTDRPTKAHEYLFLLAKSPRYYYNADAIREPHKSAHDRRNDGKRHTYSDAAKHNQVDPQRQRTKTDAVSFHPQGRNKRTVWTLPTRPFADAHFAVFPPALIAPCILAGSRPSDLVYDPFMGSGTTALVARKYRRAYIGSDINSGYVAMANRRLRVMDPYSPTEHDNGIVQPSLFASVSEVV